MPRKLVALGYFCILFQLLVVYAEKASFKSLRWFVQTQQTTPRMESSPLSCDREGGPLSALQLDGASLQWFRLDDGIMGGQSQTAHHADDQGNLHFAGTINTNGGGFASIRSKAPGGFITPSSTGITIRFRGDGKTYKLLLSEGRSGTPATTPSWQIDLPTRASSDDNDWQEAELSFRDFKPTFGGRRQSRPSEEEISKLRLEPTAMREIGLMLSLYRAGGVPNPTNTFGEGIFPFSLYVQRISVKQ